MPSTGKACRTKYRPLNCAVFDDLMSRGSCNAKPSIAAAVERRAELLLSQVTAAGQSATFGLNQILGHLITSSLSMENKGQAQGRFGRCPASGEKLPPICSGWKSIVLAQPFFLSFKKAKAAQVPAFSASRCYHLVGFAEAFVNGADNQIWSISNHPPAITGDPVQLQQFLSAMTTTRALRRRWLPPVRPLTSSCISSFRSALSVSA